MKIDMEEYNLESFKDKKIYTLDEIVEIINDLEGQVKALQEIINNLEDPDFGKPDPHDEWLEHKFQTED